MTTEKVNMAIIKELGNCGAHINITIRRTPTRRCDAGDEFDGLYLSENTVLNQHGWWR
jgi:hypothetical protein